MKIITELFSLAISPRYRVEILAQNEDTHRLRINAGGDIAEIDMTFEQLQKTIGFLQVTVDKLKQDPDFNDPDIHHDDK